MADPATNTTYPGEIDSLPEISATDKENDPGVEHDVVHDRAHSVLNALQALVGTLADTDEADTVLGRLLAIEGATGGALFGAVLAISDEEHDVLSSNAGKYHRFTFAGAKSATFRPNATHAMVADGEWHVRNASTGNLTLIAGTEVTLNPPAAGTLVVPPHGAVTVKRVAEDQFDVIGVTVAA